MRELQAVPLRTTTSRSDHTVSTVFVASGGSHRPSPPAAAWQRRRAAAVSAAAPEAPHSPTDHAVLATAGCDNVPLIGGLRP